MTASPDLRLGFVGLGQIGAPMARRWLEWPGGLTVHDVVVAATEPFGAAGAHVASSVAELAERADVISLMVRDDAQVRAVVAGADGLLTTASPGTVVVVHSTVEPDTPAELAEIAASRRVRVVDAPVSGGAIGAHEGTLALMVGGSADDVDRIRPALERLGTLVSHLGPVGAGTRAKIARNIVNFAGFVAAGEAARLAEAAGVDLLALGEVVRHSDRVTGGPGAVMLRDRTGPMAPTDGLLGPFGHTRALGEKDLELAEQLGAELGVDVPVARLARALLGDALGVSTEVP